MNKELKNLIRVAQAKGHDCDLVQPERGYDGCFWDVAWMDRNLVVSRFKVQSGKNLFAE